ncbi:MAG TPA: hypothetical protein VFJ85_01205 [Acidimicrobiales bacterium]|nr:hypothetical protein [Acidimicrobiales bacterium]
MATTTHRTRRRRRLLTPAEAAVDDQLEAAAGRLVEQLLDRCDEWAASEPPEVLDRLRRSSGRSRHA